MAKVLALDADAFVTSTLEFLGQYGLDGIDIDIEGDAIESDPFEKLVTGLATQLPTGKLLTAAVANYRRERYRALDQVAFLNVMSYDECGNWSPSPCPHSTFSQAQQDLEFWSTEYWQNTGSTFDRANVVLGVPFYGHCWGEGCAQITEDPEHTATYDQVLAFWKKSHPGSQEAVPDLLQDDAHSYYLSLNGPQTIERKALLAKNYGGIMIWELGQDAQGPDSLFSVIEKTR